MNYSYWWNSRQILIPIAFRRVRLFCDARIRCSRPFLYGHFNPYFESTANANPSLTCLYPVEPLVVRYRSNQHVSHTTVRQNFFSLRIVSEWNNLHRTSWRHRQSVRSRTGWIDTGTIWAFKADKLHSLSNNSTQQLNSTENYGRRCLTPLSPHRNYILS